MPNLESVYCGEWLMAIEEGGGGKVAVPLSKQRSAFGTAICYIPVTFTEGKRQEKRREQRYAKSSSICHLVIPRRVLRKLPAERLLHIQQLHLPHPRQVAYNGFHRDFRPRRLHSPHNRLEEPMFETQKAKLGWAYDAASSIATMNKIFYFAVSHKAQLQRWADWELSRKQALLEILRAGTIGIEVDEQLAALQGL
ncbi:hypothetical protein QBC46DRAFT_336462 [Diplogelasinospora grovesii]|uniref:Uncharacterized protein n=1 Tax=Diplogelasinospora grovesii TaxID=303347 RepID=A0AAN6S9R2_9PEZI|nr:hypothetical protein QBC46DRAFT_336462 [Diplogelasinospora grovesii]